METDLAGLCHEMVAIPSVSHDEAKLAGFVESYLSEVAGLGVSRLGNNIIAKSISHSSNNVIIAGHLDTVPPDDNQVPYLKNGRIYGLGSSDMKAGLAVMLGLAGITSSFSVGTTFIFYAREEVAASQSGLLEIERMRPDVLQSDAAVLMEPTSGCVEAGCQGTMRVNIEVRGKRAHTARPWAGVNAIHRLGGFISRIADAALDNPVIDGLQFQESLQIVKVMGGVANNVVPDLATMVVNHRFAPDKDVESAFAFISSLVGDLLEPENGDSISLEEGVPGAVPYLDNELISKLMDVSGEPPRAKLGWTDVAFFSARGIPATNFGPGDPLVAHTKDEFVEISEIESVFSSMRAALGG